MQLITLFTLQATGHDLANAYNPLPDYASELGGYYEISRFLGWEHWVWHLSRLEDFENEWFNDHDYEFLNRFDLWMLAVPESVIKWCALNPQCENQTPVGTWFFADQETIRLRGDIPQALVRRPIDPSWIIFHGPAVNTPLLKGL